MNPKILAVLAAVLLLSSCGGSAPAPYGGGDSDITDGLYHSDMWTDRAPVPLKINMTNGNPVFPCPDPLCPHTMETETCRLYMISVSKTVEATADKIIYSAYVFGEHKHKIFSFDISGGTTELLYTYDKYPASNAEIIYGEGKLFFDVSTVAPDENGSFIELPERDVICLDLSTKKTSVFGKKRDLNDRMLFYEEGYLYFRRDPDYEIRKTRGGRFDSAETVTPPDGHSFDFTDMMICPKYCYRSFPPSALYLTDENRFLDIGLGESEGPCGVFRGSGKFYYSVNKSGGPYTADCISQDKNTPGFFDCDICVNTPGEKVERYRVSSDYCISVLAGYGMNVFCEIIEKYIDGEENRSFYGDDDADSFTRSKYLFLNLETGNGILYDLNPPGGIPADITAGTVKLEVSKLN